MKKSSILAIFYASSITLSTSVDAVPVTLDFTGVINFYTDFMGNVTYGVGTSFSGYVTYDVDNAEDISFFSQTNPASTSGFATSQSGCVGYTNGVCTNDRGSGTPVVTDYMFNWIGGVVTPWGYSLDYQDSSRRVNIFDIPPSITGETWEVGRNQFRSDIAGDVNNSDYTRTLSRRAFFVKASSTNDALLSGPLDNFMQGFNMDVLFSDGSSDVTLSNFISVETCTPSSCTTTYNSGSYQWTGELTNISFSVVPIPPALWLFGSGLLGLIGLARKKRND